MSDMTFCLLCGENIGIWDKICPYCGEHQFGENDEFYPTEENMHKARKILAEQNKSVKKQRKGFTEEEILALGLHPQDEGYKMSLISRILGRK